MVRSALPRDQYGRVGLAYLGVDSVELLLGEDSEEIPGEVQTLKDSTRLVGT